VDKRVVANVRRTNPSDQALVELTSWSAMAAARRISQWAQPAVVTERADPPAERLGA